MSDIRHGTKSGYNQGCRQDCCRVANMRALKVWRMGQRPKLIDPTGTRRRIRALMTLGWTQGEISQAAGKTSRGWAREVVEQPRVTETTAATIARIYDEWSMTIPEGKYRARSRSIAARQGWPPPLAWTNIDDPDEQPTDWHYRAPDRAVTFDELVSRGDGLADVCRVMEMSPRAVEIWCRRNQRGPDYSLLGERDRGHIGQSNGWTRKAAS